MTRALKPFPLALQRANQSAPRLAGWTSCAGLTPADSRVWGGGGTGPRADSFLHFYKHIQTIFLTKVIRSRRGGGICCSMISMHRTQYIDIGPSHLIDI